MDWAGGCLCGDIRFRANKDPEWVGHCHCSICRRQTGTAFTTGVIFAEETFEWTQGKPVYFNDSLGIPRSFCTSCGSSMTWEPSGRGVCVFAGSLDRVEDLRPTSHVYTSTMLPWVKLDDGLPQYSGTDAGSPVNRE